MTTAQKAKQATVQAANTLSWQTTLVVLLSLAGSIFLTYTNKISGDAFVGVIGAILGGVLVQRGVSSGSAASNSPPPPEG